MKTMRNPAAEGEAAARADARADTAAATSRPCFRCGAPAREWFDGPGAGARRRAICAPCEYGDHRRTAAAYTTGQVL